MAEGAVQRAADLAGDAERAAVRFGDVDALDLRALVEGMGRGHPHQPLPRAVGRHLLGDNLGPGEGEALGELVEHRPGDVAHFGEIASASVVNPVPELRDAHFALALGHADVFERACDFRPRRAGEERQRSDSGAGGGGHGWVSTTPRCGAASISGSCEGSRNVGPPAKVRPGFAISGFPSYVWDASSLNGERQHDRTDAKSSLSDRGGGFRFSLAPAEAAQCGNTPEGFKAWLEDFKQVAINDGVSPDVVDSALGKASFDASVLRHDQAQSSWNGDAAGFAASHVTAGRIKRGKQMMLAYAEPLDRIEQTYGVPAPMLVAIWGLETDFGGALGQYPTFNALATLAYDCRRGSLYRAELVDALMIVQRGLLTPEQMRGRLGGRTGPNPVHALRLPEIWRRRAWRPRREPDARLRRPPWPRPRISSVRTAGSGAPGGTRGSRTSPLSSNGTRPSSTPRRSRSSPTS